MGQNPVWAKLSLHIIAFPTSQQFFKENVFAAFRAELSCNCQLSVAVVGGIFFRSADLCLEI